MGTAVVLWVVLAVVAGLILAGIVRHGLRTSELAREARADGFRPVGLQRVDAAPPSDDEGPARRARAREMWRRMDTARAARIIGGARAAIAVPPVVPGLEPFARDEPTQVLEVVAVDRRRMVSVVDELGTWEPWAHEPVDAAILGDVLAWRKWHTLRPVHVGMGSL